MVDDRSVAVVRSPCDRPNIPNESPCDVESTDESPDVDSCVDVSSEVIDDCAEDVCEIPDGVVCETDVWVNPRSQGSRAGAGDSESLASILDSANTKPSPDS